MAGTWMSQEVSKRLVSGLCHPSISHLQLGFLRIYQAFTKFLGHPSSYGNPGTTHLQVGYN